jgi:solute carrier family 29 (equilibrative nucleoside transporter), member 1/2/3
MPKNNLGVWTYTGDAPQDKGMYVYIVFFLQGIGLNLPWNVYITAVSYFHARLQTTEFSNTFEQYFTSTYTFSNLLFMLMVVVSADQSFFNMRSSVVVPQIITCIVFAATTYLVYTTMVPESFFYATVLMVGFCGISAALVQSGIFGLAGRFPPLYTQAVMSGQGIAGVIVSITSLSSVLGTPCSGNHTISLPITTRLVFKATQ